ncbi:aryl-alcohol dehydrogenase-like predicted oxidoreductase [Nakamurella sp. UYEF19]|uniref:aldo/keto reductase n=1 Tax=Nakamurella sp. UYEF19 TaxID=1756392 RepID=UPI003398070E
MTQTKGTINRTIPGTDLEVFPLSLGGNVFDWTADEATSFDILDAYAAGGGNFIDTADAYSAWVPGHTGGESEVVIGKWMAARGNRDQMVIATKVGALTDLQGASIRSGVEASLRRLGTDHIDLYYAHRDDLKNPLDETVAAFAEAVSQGKVRAVAASNYSAARLAEALKIADDMAAPRFVALQPHYNLVHRHEFEGDVQDLVSREGLVTAPYSSLASGFLTGKYRTSAADGQSPRAEGASRYLNESGLRVLAALDQVAAEHSTSVGTVALAWLAAQPTVIAPIASASKVSQVEGLLAAAHLVLTNAQLATLTAASD